MDVAEKGLARIMFQNKIYSSDGQKFEDLFVSIMNYKCRDFQAIKAWGNIGDRKNDGYIKDDGIYFQVFSPEDITKSYTNIIRKLNDDFKGLLDHWDGINEYYFVINDKYKGVNADSEISLNKLKTKYNLNEAKFLTAKDLENILFDLEDDQIFSIIGHIPDPSRIKTINYSVLDEVVKHIMELSFNDVYTDDYIAPDWNEKIIFNKLSSRTKAILESGFIHVYEVDRYLENNSDFLKETLKDKFHGVYLNMKENSIGDELFMRMIVELSPANSISYQNIISILMSKYFETCDIFEEPEGKYDNA